ncbi:hypothetical protein [Dactylosporangium salmoneum]|uniref:DNA-binding protein n=1 Tax=Dactylosporangium salmoneum TaxID=53361 RepID=A0ABN3GK39_9ACTN
MTRLRQFRLMVAGGLPDAAADALFDRADDLCVEVGTVPAAPEFDGLPCALPAADGAVAWVAFDRMAPGLLDAVVSAVRDLDAAGLGAAAAVADDSLVTVETVAERLGRPAEVVRAWPLPGVVFAHPRRPVYDWAEVAEFLAGRAGYRPPDEEPTFTAVTLLLQVRALAPRLERMGPLRTLLL